MPPPSVSQSVLCRSPTQQICAAVWATCPHHQWVDHRTPCNTKQHKKVRLPPARAHSATSVRSTLQRTSLRPPAGRCYLALSDATQSDALSIILQDFSSSSSSFLERHCSVLHDVSLSKTLHSAALCQHPGDLRSQFRRSTRECDFYVDHLSQHKGCLHSHISLFSSSRRSPREGEQRGTRKVTVDGVKWKTRAQTNSEKVTTAQVTEESTQKL